MNHHHACSIRNLGNSSLIYIKAKNSKLFWDRNTFPELFLFFREIFFPLKISFDFSWSRDRRKTRLNRLIFRLQLALKINLWCFVACRSFSRFFFFSTMTRRLFRDNKINFLCSWEFFCVKFSTAILGDLNWLNARQQLMWQPKKTSANFSFTLESRLSIFELRFFVILIKLFIVWRNDFGSRLFILLASGERRNSRWENSWFSNRGFVCGLIELSQSEFFRGGVK